MDLDDRPAHGARAVIRRATAAYVVGMASYGVRERTATIRRLSVRPDRQREGLGGALLESVLREVQDDADRVTLAYMDGNVSASRFYAARGFVETHREADELGGPDDVWMELKGGPIWCVGGAPIAPRPHQTDRGHALRATGQRPRDDERRSMR